MLAFAAVPSNKALACSGKKDGCQKEVQKEKEKQSTCEKEAGHSSPCKHKGDCGGKCGDKGCDCPAAFPTAQTAFTSIDFTLRPPTRYLLSKADWYYLHKIPNAVYLSIWIPPKISC